MMKSIKGIESIRESFKTRQVKYGGYAALITLAVITGLILLNLMMGEFSPQVDLTSNRLYSLSEQTLQVLDSIDTPVRFYGLWRPGTENQDVITVVNLYLSRNRNIHLEVLDPDRHPGFVNRYDRERRGIQQGSLIVEGERGFRLISPWDMYDISQSQSGPEITGISVERRITNALLFASTGVTPVAYEITGHDEILLSDLRLNELVERENYELRSLNLFVSPVPSDASLLIINAPRRDLAPAEAERLLDYLEQGGRLLVLADHNIRDFAALNEVFASYGFRFDFGIVHEPDPNYFALDQRLVLPDLLDHDVTRPLLDKSRTPVVLPTAMPFSVLTARRQTVEITPLMTTSGSAFLRTNLEESSSVRVASDVSGPFTLGVAVMDPSWIQGDEPQTRIIAIGCSNLLPFYVQGGIEANWNLFMNSFAWLAEQPQTISVRSKSLFLLPLRLNQVQIILFGALFIFIIPMAFFIAGFVIWLKRRHL